jgi:hypothetical protein
MRCNSWVRFSVLAVGLVGFSLSVFCERPRDIMLEANFSRNELYIRIINPITSSHKYYIRKVEVAIDDQPPITRYFYFQKIGYDKSLTLAVEDLASKSQVRIKAYNEQGATVERTFNVQELRGAR